MLQRAGSDAGNLFERSTSVNTDKFCSFINSLFIIHRILMQSYWRLLYNSRHWFLNEYFTIPQKYNTFFYDQKKIIRDTYRLSPTICSAYAPEVLLEAIFQTVMSTAVGCCSDKLAWIKCQPLSRFSLPGATVNLFTGEQVRKSSPRYEIEMWKMHKVNRWKDEIPAVDLLRNSFGID